MLDGKILHVFFFVALVICAILIIAYDAIAVIMIRGPFLCLLECFYTAMKFTVV